MQSRLLRAALGTVPLLLLLALAAPAAAQETQDTMSLPEALRTSRAELGAAFAKLDAAAAAAVFTTDGAIEFQGQTVAGRQGVNGWFAEVFVGMSGVKSGSSAFVVADGTVTERASYVATGVDGDVTGTTETVWKKQADGSWKVARMIIM